MLRISRYVYSGMLQNAGEYGTTHWSITRFEHEGGELGGVIVGGFADLALFYRRFADF